MRLGGANGYRSPKAPKPRPGATKSGWFEGSSSAKRRMLYKAGRAEAAAYFRAGGNDPVGLLQAKARQRQVTGLGTPAFLAGIRSAGRAKGRNLGSFKGRSGSWKKGAGGRFVGSA